MKIKPWFFASVVAAWLACTSAYAQDLPLYPPPAPIANGNGGLPGATPYTPGGGVFSDWITYKRDCCEGHEGRATPLFTELYLRSGPSTPIGGQTLGRELQTGWSIMGGGRALFFNEPLTKAWTVDLHIINTYECGGKNTPFPLTVFQGSTKSVFGANGIPGVTVKGANRTMVGLGAGKEYYLWQPANCTDHTCRVGFDFGGRYGSMRLDFHETRRQQDVIGSLYAAIHADVDCPTRYGVWFTGVRLEWAYTWSDILQTPSDIQDISLLFTVGSRF